MMKPLTALLACLAAAVHAASGQTGEKATNAPTAVMRQGIFEVSGRQLAVDEGRFAVPANRASGSPATLTLAFVRFRTTAATPGAPIVFLAGGPGDAATRALRGMPLDFLNELRSIADVIAFDQRGTGMSEPRNVVCPPASMLPRDRPGDPASMLDSLRHRVLECLNGASRDGVDVLGLTTEESADDLETLGRAVGAKKLTLLAGSYGTHLALATARRHPELVDRMALAGVEGFDDTFKLPSRVESVLATIARARYPRLLDDIRTLRSRLAVEPARFTFATGQTIVLGEWDLQRWIATSLATVREIEAMLAAIPLLLDGDYAALAQATLRSRLAPPLNLMNLAMDCASFGSPERLGRIAREAPATLLGNAINFPLPDLCAIPGLPRLTDAYRTTSRTIDTPTLLISGTFDGRTPVQNALDVARTLPRSRSLAIDGASHGLFQEAAVLDAVLAFFRE